MAKGWPMLLVRSKMQPTLLRPPATELIKHQLHEQDPVAVDQIQLIGCRWLAPCYVCSRNAAITVIQEDVYRFRIFGPS